MLCTATALATPSGEPPGAAVPLSAAHLGHSGGERTTQALYAVPTTRDQIGRILAPVTVNGRGPFRFMVDTGATHTVLAASLLPKLGLTANTQARANVHGINGSVQAPTALVLSLDAGALHLRDAQIPVLSGPVLKGIDGIIGLDALNGRSMTVDFEHDRISIGSAFSGVPLDEAVVPARLVSQRLFEVDAQVAGIPVKAVIDTGGPRTLGNVALLRAVEHKTGAGVVSILTGVVDATDVSQAAHFEPVPSLQLGSLTITRPYVTFGDFRVFQRWGLRGQPALLIGMDVLGVFADMTISYRWYELGLRPTAQMIALQ